MCAQQLNQRLPFGAVQELIPHFLGVHHLLHHQSCKHDRHLLLSRQEDTLDLEPTNIHRFHWFKNNFERNRIGCIANDKSAKRQPPPRLVIPPTNRLSQPKRKSQIKSLQPDESQPALSQLQKPERTN